MSDIEPGTVAGKYLLINYHEDLWFGFNAERQQFCKETWIDRAKSMDEVRVVVLRLIPDDLFPMHGKEKPYIEWQYDIDRPPECGFSVTAQVHVSIMGSGKFIDPVVRADISRALEGHKRGTPFYILNGEGTLLEQGSI